jgi:hypothetical protein
LAAFGLDLRVRAAAERRDNNVAGFRTFHEKVKAII